MERAGVVITYDLYIKPGAVRRAAELVQRELVESRKAEGCVDIQIFVEPGTDTLFLYERWESPEHAEKYLQWRRDSDRKNPLVEADLLARTPLRRTFEEV
jgi:quinol monooxygenase YgiN